MDNGLERLGAAVKSARRDLEMTQQELADMLNISRHHLLKIEKGHENPSYSLLCLLISELCIPADNIFHPESCCLQSEFDEIVIILKNCDDMEILAFLAILKSRVKYKKSAVTENSNISA
ncbi:MAG: helix-turn-helix domain-containing protein [Oscillospiraceae bacterium]|jgi:DNA-binding XRE family transcriptional regulator|nr:helix-turn-helix domain-containing protein [Oscillospiraceae bacterium]